MITCSAYLAFASFEETLHGISTLNAGVGECQKLTERCCSCTILDIVLAKSMKVKGSELGRGKDP